MLTTNYEPLQFKASLILGAMPDEVLTAIASSSTGESYFIAILHQSKAAPAFFAWNIARALNLNTPDFFLCHVSENVLSIALPKNIITKYVGHCFSYIWPCHSNLLKPCQFSQYRSELERIAALDLILCNPRHKSEAGLFLQSDDKLLCTGFEGRAGAGLYRVPMSNEPPQCLSVKQLRHCGMIAPLNLDTIETVCNQWKAVITHDWLFTLETLMPESWRTGENEQNFNRLINFLSRRTESFEVIREKVALVQGHQNKVAI